MPREEVGSSEEEEAASSSEQVAAARPAGPNQQLDAAKFKLRRGKLGSFCCSERVFWDKNKSCCRAGMKFWFSNSPTTCYQAGIFTSVVDKS